jgi:hypothetical protein
MDYPKYESFTEFIFRTYNKNLMLVDKAAAADEFCGLHTVRDIADYMNHSEWLTAHLHYTIQLCSHYYRGTPRPTASSLIEADMLTEINTTLARLWAEWNPEREAAAATIAATAAAAAAAAFRATAAAAAASLETTAEWD